MDKDTDIYTYSTGSGGGNPMPPTGPTHSAMVDTAYKLSLSEQNCAWILFVDLALNGHEDIPVYEKVFATTAFIVNSADRNICQTRHQEKEKEDQLKEGC